MVDILVARSLQALEVTGLKRLVVAGGVGANLQLRARLKDALEADGRCVYYPRSEFCTDNAAMVALAGTLRFPGAARPIRIQPAGPVGTRRAATTLKPPAIQKPIHLDTIFLRDLRVRTIVGIWEWERRMPQLVSIDLEMAADVRRAAASDNIADTLDYKAVSKRVIGFVEDSSFNLVETLAERVAEVVTREFAVPWVKVAIHKPWAIRGSRDVGIVVERGSRQTAAR